MIPPVCALFYLWITQKPLENSTFAPLALERLRAPSVTMGLQERNLLFFAASLLVIIAMAQPVLFERAGIHVPRANVFIAIDVSRQSPEELERSKERALALIAALEGENIGVGAYDSHPYLIAPLTRDRGGISELVRGLDVIRTDISDPNVLIEELSRTEHTDDAVSLVLVGPDVRIPPQERDRITVIPLREGESAEMIAQRIRADQKDNRSVPKIPLFFYPLGLSLLLIWIGLSSMSKRRSVPLGAVLLLVLSHLPTHAGLLDFRVLHEAQEAYVRGEYDRSAELFARYQSAHDGPQIRYNRANALYMGGHYAQARIWYERVHTSDPDLAERTRYNLGRTIGMLELSNPHSGVKSPQEDTPYADSKKKIAEEKGKAIRRYPPTRLYKIP